MATRTTGKRVSRKTQRAAIAGAGPTVATTSTPTCQRCGKRRSTGYRRWMWTCDGCAPDTTPDPACSHSDPSELPGVLPDGTRMCSWCGGTLEPHLRAAQ